MAGKYYDRRTGTYYDELPDWAMKVSDTPEEYQKEYYEKYGSSQVQPNAGNQLDKADAEETRQATVDDYINSEYSAGNFLSKGLFNQLNFTSPTSWIGAGINAFQGEGNLEGVASSEYSSGNWGIDFLNNMYYGNSGIVTDKFQQEHPWLTMGVNVFGDGAAYGIAGNASKLNTIPKLLRSQKWYSGVSHELRPNAQGMSVYMDENFPNFQGTRWFSNSKRFAKNWAHGSNGPGTVYSAYVDPKEISIYQPPKVKGNSNWSSLPYKFENGRLVVDPEYRFTVNDGMGGKYLSPLDPKEYTYHQYIENTMRDVLGRPLTETDDVVKYAINNGYQATRMNNLYEGAVKDVFGRIRSKPIDDLILHEGTPMQLADSKLDLAKQLGWNFDYIPAGATSNK